MTPALTASVQRNLLVNAEQIRALYSQLPKSTAGMIAGGLVVIGAMWDQVSHPALLAWFAAMLLNQIWRLFLFARYRRNPPAPEEARRWGGYWVIGAGISGIIWGSAGIFMFVPDAPGYQAFLIIALFAVTTGAVTLIAVHAPSFHAFVLPTILPVIVRVALEGDAIHFYTAAACALVLITLLAFGRNLNKLLTESLHNRFENVDLITQLTAQKQVAEQARHVAEAATRARTQIFAAASHDLRQPLHAMGLFAAALSEKIRDPEILDGVNSINASVHTLESLFNELLDISKIDAGAIKPEPRDFALKPVLDRLRNEFSTEASEKGLRLSLRAGDCNVWSDPVLLERILRNLVSNAIRNTEIGEIALVCHEHDGKLLLEVQDTGIGIPAEHQARIFDEFYQISIPGRTSAKGLGLGLSIVKRLCDLLGYPVRFSSRVGGGSVFSVEVPLATISGAPPPSPAVPRPAGDLTGKLIVVIDDEPAIIQGMKILLGGWGATVITSDTGEDVVAAVHAAGKLPDLIVADYRLGTGPDGIEMVQRIRQDLDPAIPAILVTGTMVPDLVESARNARLEFLLKPVIPETLRSLIILKLQPAAGGSNLNPTQSATGSTD